MSSPLTTRDFFFASSSVLTNNKREKARAGFMKINIALPEFTIA